MIWPSWSKWPLLGVTITAIVMSSPPDEGQSAAAESGNSQQIEPAVQPARQRQKTLQSSQHAARVELERLERKPEVDAVSGVANVFNSTSWYVPPPPPPVIPVVPLPPPTPVAPPLPFSYFGRYDDPPARIVILAKGDRLYTASEGDVIDATYRVARIEEGMVTLTYLPLNTDQSISTGGKQ